MAGIAEREIRSLTLVIAAMALFGGAAIEAFAAADRVEVGARLSALGVGMLLQFGALKTGEAMRRRAGG